MIIQLLEDNTVSARHPNGALEAINSTHSHKALSPLTKVIADLFPYKGAMDFSKDHPVLRFNGKSGIVSWGRKAITPEDDLSALPDDVKLFCETVRTPEVIAAYEASRPAPQVEYEMVDKPSTQVEMVDGKPTLVTRDVKVAKTRNVRVQNENGTPAFDALGRPMFVRQKIVKGG